jgi:hypothetical protein
MKRRVGDEAGTGRAEDTADAKVAALLTTTSIPPHCRTSEFTDSASVSP